MGFNDQQQPNQNINPAQMLELMKQFAQELKKPTADEQTLIDEKKARQKANLDSSIREAKADEQRKQIEQSACSHMKPHPYVGRTRIVAPLHSDGLHHPRCLFCHKEFKPFPPGPDTIPMGMSMDDLSGINSQIIEHWGNRYAVQKQGQNQNFVVK